MEQLKIIWNSPISNGLSKFNGKDYFNILKKQSLTTYEYLLSKTDEQNLNFYLPQVFNNLLTSITSLNQFILNLNLFLQKHYSKQNNDQDYNRIILETIFAHHNIFPNNKSIFDNKLSPQFVFLFDFLDNSNVEMEKLTRLKEIAIVFCVIESFFRHHQAHGLSNSLTDFFRGYNIQIFPTIIIKNEYFQINNFKSFDKEIDKFCFLCPEQHFNHFYENIAKIIKEIKEYEISNNKIDMILENKLKTNIENVFIFKEEKRNIKNPSKKELNPFNYCFIHHEFKRNFLFVRSEIIRSYFKYNSIIWNNDINASNIDLIKEALSLWQYKLTDNNEIIYTKNISITPESLLNYFKEFVDIIETLLFND